MEARDEEKVYFRGVVAVPKSRLTKTCIENLTALPKRSKTAPGKAVPFPVYMVEQGNLLIPKYVYASKFGLKTSLAKISDKIIYAAPPLSPEKRKLEFTGTLFDKQKPGVEAALSVLQKKNGVTIKGKCGSGKTVVGTYLLARIHTQRSVVMVDQLHVAEQWAETIHRFIPAARISFIMPMAEQRKICKKVGLDAAKRTKIDTSGDIVIAMAQTTYRNIKVTEPIEAALLIVDEAHKFSAPTFIATVFRFSFRYSVSLTATDERADGLSWVFKGCLGPEVVLLEGKRMTPIVFTLLAPLREKINLSDHRMYFCDRVYKMMTKWSCKTCESFDVCRIPKPGQKIKYSEVWSRLSNDFVYNEFLLQIIYRLWERDRRVLIFSKFCAHLSYLRKRTMETGVPENDTALFFGGMDKEKCLAPRLTFTTYKNSEHALDAPDKDACLLCMPITRVEQTAGRVERFKKGKHQPIVIDPLVRCVSTFRYQHESHLRFYRKEGYETIDCIDVDDAFNRLDLRNQAHQRSTE